MEKKKINRREFISRSIKGAAGLSATVCLGKAAVKAPYIKNNKITDRMIVLGIDGMDPGLLQHFIQRGEMPVFKKFIERNYFNQLQTTIPPQSPVAWSSFISGCNPGKHGIFDFIHRDARTFIPYLSTSRTYGSESSLKLGNLSIPLQAGKVELLRKGPALWEVLKQNDVPSTIYKMPANYPVEDTEGSNMISGLGTPDLLGTYGTFTFFTDVEIPGAESFTGGRVVQIKPEDHIFKSRLDGPSNPFRSDHKDVSIEFTVRRDPWEKVVKIDIQGQEILLKQGEWSDWVPLKFAYLPAVASSHGMVRIYIQEVHPHFRIYMSPINIDPMNPDMPIASPDSYSIELAKAIGRFYTQGMPEDTKTLSNNIFSDEEFFTQSKIVLKERLKAFEYQIDGFSDGLFFFYFSSLDQNSHVMLRYLFPDHPLYDPKASQEVKDTVYYYYKSMDKVLKRSLDKLNGRGSLLILSDHGFAPFGRQLHLSTWLAENGFTVFTDPGRAHQSEFYEYVDWSRTKAYAMGLNGIYLNLFGREKNGSVFPRNRQKIKDQIIEKLESFRDPETNRSVVRKAYDTEKVFHGPNMDIAPDIIVGYESGYRISDEAALGKFPKETVSIRKDKWSADHCMAPDVVPGILLSNFAVTGKNPGLWDITPTILKKFGITTPDYMDGKPIC